MLIIIRINNEYAIGLQNRYSLLVNIFCTFGVFIFKHIFHDSVKLIYHVHFLMTIQWTIVALLLICKIFLWLNKAKISLKFAGKNVRIPRVYGKYFRSFICRQFFYWMVPIFLSQNPHLFDFKSGNIKCDLHCVHSI